MYIVNTVLHQGVPINDDDDNAWLSLRFQAGEVASSHEVPLLPPQEVFEVKLLPLSKRHYALPPPKGNLHLEYSLH